MSGQKEKWEVGDIVEESFPKYPKLKSSTYLLLERQKRSGNSFKVLDLMSGEVHNYTLNPGIDNAVTYRRLA